MMVALVVDKAEKDVMVVAVVTRVVVAVEWVAVVVVVAGMVCSNSNQS